MRTVETWSGLSTIVAPTETPKPTSSVTSAATYGAREGTPSGLPAHRTSQLHRYQRGCAGGWNNQTPIWTSASSQQVVQSDGQVHELVECEGGVSTGQLPTNVLE